MGFPPLTPTTPCAPAASREPPAARRTTTHGHARPPTAPDELWGTSSSSSRTTGLLDVLETRAIFTATCLRRNWGRVVVVVVRVVGIAKNLDRISPLLNRVWYLCVHLFPLLALFPKSRISVGLPELDVQWCTVDTPLCEPATLPGGARRPMRACHVEACRPLTWLCHYHGQMVE